MKTQSLLKIAVFALILLPQISLASKMSITSRMEGPWTKIGATCLLPGQSVEPYLIELRKQLEDNPSNLTRIDLEGSRYVFQMKHDGNDVCVLRSTGVTTAISEEDGVLMSKWTKLQNEGCLNNKGIEEGTWIGDNITYQISYHTVQGQDYLVQIRDDLIGKGAGEECHITNVWARPLLY